MRRTSAQCCTVATSITAFTADERPSRVARPGTPAEVSAPTTPPVIALLARSSPAFMACAAAARALHRR